MNITFTSLLPSHLPLLFRWLNMPHVRAWWDSDIAWTEALIEEKYLSYTAGYKLISNVKIPLYAFIIEADDVPVGYIQYYNKYDFPTELGGSTDRLPESLAAIDFYIGESDYLGKDIGSQALGKFLKEHVAKKFRYCFVDPDTANTTAIRTYKKAGFSTLEENQEWQVTWMLAAL